MLFLLVILIIITLLVVSVTGQVIEFDPSLNDTIYIEVCMYTRVSFDFELYNIFLHTSYLISYAYS